MIIYLGLPSPVISSDPPESTTGSRIAFFSVLLRMGFTYALLVTKEAVVSYTALPTLPTEPAVYFCCTILRVASTGRYPASCPMKPGLSSPAAFRHMQLRSFILLISYIHLLYRSVCLLSNVFCSQFILYIDSRYNTAIYPFL